MRVLLMADGSSIHTVRYQAELKRQGVEVVLASLEFGDTVDIQMKKKSVSSSISYFFANRQIKELVKKFDPDIVNAHFATGYGFSTAMSKVWKKVPVLLHCLGSDILISPGKSIAHKRRVIYALARAKAVLTDSQFLADRVKSLYKCPDVSIIPWGIESEIGEIFQEKEKKNFKMSSPVRILVPRPHQIVYNNEFIIRALQDIINNREIALSFPDWGDFTVRFKRLVAEICPDGLVEFYRFLPREKYIEFLAQHDVYLSGSLSDSSPASLIEAMGAGLWPVVGDIPGVAELIDCNNGHLFDIKNRDSLGRVFDQVLSVEFNPVEILKANHKRILDDFIFEKNIAETIRIMERLIRDGQ